MEFILQNANFSIIGNMLPFLRNRAQDFLNTFSEYEVNSKTDDLPDGTKIKSYLLKKENIALKITTERVDCQVKSGSNNKSADELFKTSCTIYKKLEAFNAELCGSRIAIVLQGFIKNNQNEAVEYFNDKMKLGKAFGESNELHLKINNPQKSFEMLNSVLNIDMGVATNNATKETSQILIVSIDVNTLAENKNVRFSPKQYEMFFRKLQKQVTEKLDALKKYIK